jgi:uncharacterized protein
MFTDHAHRPVPAPLRGGVAPLVVVVAVLAAYNVVGNLLVPAAWYIPTNLAMAALLLFIAHRAGLGATELGLQRSRLAAGARWGAGAAALAVAVVALGALVPAAGNLYVDDRVDVGGWGLAYHTVARIPLGTVVLEEVAFRGVLLGLLVRHLRWRFDAGHPSDDKGRALDRRALGWAVVVSSALFGLWHIIPSMPAADGNAPLDAGADSMAATVGLVSGAVVATALAGLVFCWLRLRSGSLLAPMLLHVGTNSGSFAVAWLVTG